jgi:long-chain acyl-CoA synthetase
VVAAPDEVLGQRPIAFVIAAEPWRWPELEPSLREAAEAALPRPKRPAAFCLMQELPLGPTGKVARRRLRELAAT